MLSQRHESLLLLFRNRSTLAAESLHEAPRIKVPEYEQARIDSADLTDVQPAEYRADLVVTLVGADAAPAMSIVVEVQLAVDERKRWVWPAYVANLRARLKCPVCLLVVTLDEAVARWAAKPVEVGGESRLVPVVLGPMEIAEVTDLAEACAAPERSVLSVMAHGRVADRRKAIQMAKAAFGATVNLDEDRQKIYSDLVHVSLSEELRQELETMGVLMLGDKPYEFQSDYLKKFIAIGVAKGQAEIILRQLALRFGALNNDVRSRVEKASADELAAIGERLLTAQTLQQTLDPQ